jgi:hypothetical protein
MLSRFHSVGIAALILPFICGAFFPAHADVYMVTTQGLITYGVDLSGLFGSVGSLVGENYSLSMTFDSALNADGETMPTEQCLYSDLYLTAVASVTATVGGVTISLPQSEAPGGFCIGQYTTGDRVDAEFNSTGYQALISADSQGENFIPFPHLNELSFPITYDPSTDTSGGMTETLTELRIPNEVEINTYGATLLTITDTTSVPEPATWITMLLGLFGVGFIMRGFRRKAAILADKRA